MPTSYSWPLLPDAAPAAPTPTQAAEVSATQAAAATSRGLPSFLGTGIMRPFRRDEKNDFAVGAGVDLVKSRIGQIIGTKANSATTPGELPWRSDFGSRVHLVRHRNNNVVSDDLATLYVREAVAKWEPFVSSTSATVSRTFDQRAKEVLVKFNIVDAGGRVTAANQDALVPFQPAS